MWLGSGAWRPKVSGLVREKECLRGARGFMADAQGVSCFVSDEGGTLVVITFVPCKRDVFRLRVVVSRGFQGQQAGTRQG